MSEQVEPKTTAGKETKPRYESPKVILLNEITIGQGAACYPGTSVTDDCQTGSGAPTVCFVGVSAVADCTEGSGGFQP